jgi:hypothetical protein
VEPHAFFFDSMLTIWYGFSSVLLGIVLFFPVRKFILNLNINRFQSKMNRKITVEELALLKKKITIVAVVLSVTFAFLYNKIVFLNFIAPA